MKAQPFSEEDIQNYLDGHFTGDVAALESYIHQHTGLKQVLDEYRLIMAAIESEAYDLSFDLPAAVLRKIESEKKARKPVAFLFALPAIMLTALVIVAAFILRLDLWMKKLESPLLFTLLSLSLIAATVMFSLPELAVKRKAFRRYMQSPPNT